MIRGRGQISSKQAADDLAAWASLFTGKLFAMIVVYADETGTGGIPKSGEEPAPGLYGYLETPAAWDAFRIKWNTMLKKHDAPHFHFRELDPNYRKQHPESVFASWDNERKDNFIYDMAFVAGCGPIPFGGNHPRKKQKTDEEAYEMAIDGFFRDFADQMTTHFPNEQGQASFFFADLDNETWIAILNRKMKKARQVDKRIAEEYILINPLTERGTPCQAADILAYVHRQDISKIYDSGRILPLRILDLATGRKSFNVGPYTELAVMDDAAWYDLIQDLRRDKKRFEEQRERLGLKKQIYYPHREHPFFRESFNKWAAFQPFLAPEWTSQMSEWASQIRH